MVCDSAVCQPEGSWSLATGAVRPAALAPDESRVALWLRLDQAAGGENLFRPNPKLKPGETLARPRRFGIWNLNSRELETEFDDAAAFPEGKAVSSPDGRWLAYACTNYVIRLWDTQAREHARFAARHPWFISGLQFSADGRRLFTGCWDGTGRVWDLASHRQVTTLSRSHLGSVDSPAYTHHSLNLITRGEGQLRVWSARTGQEMLVFKEHHAIPFAVSPDGDWLLTRSANSSQAFEIHHLPSLEEIDLVVSQER